MKTRERRAYRRLLSDLSSMLQEGVPLIEALESLSSSPGGAASGLALDLHNEVTGGASFAEAMANSTLPVPPEHVALARAGEVSGQLPDVLRSIVDMVERQEELVRRNAPRLLYLAGVVAATAMCALLILVIRAERWGWTLPVLAGVVASFVVIRQYMFRRSTEVPTGLSTLGRKLPWFGGVLKELDTGRAMGTAGNLMAAGLPLSEAVVLTSETAVDEDVREEWWRVGLRLEAKSSATGALGGLRVLEKRPELRTRVAAAEKAGAIDRLLRTMGRELERDAENRLDLGLKMLNGALFLLAAAGVFLYGYSVFVAPLQNILNE